MKKHLFFAIFFYCSIMYSQIPSYYNGIDVTQSGETIKTSLATLITDSQHTDLSYTPGVWETLKQTDLDPSNSNNVLLIYGYDDSDGSTTNDRTRSKNQNGGGSTDWNREHVFPKSLGNPNLGTSGPGSDAHHIRSSDVGFNSQRSNLPFQDASGNARKINNSWYPGDEWKGDVARMVMYMYLRYDTRCLPANVGIGSQNYHADMKDLFLEWNAEDPVSQYEINRNDLLETIQGNRNPFIDNPAFATTIWGGPQAQDRFNGQTTTPSFVSGYPKISDLLYLNSNSNGTVYYQIVSEGSAPSNIDSFETNATGSVSVSAFTETSVNLNFNSETQDIYTIIVDENATKSTVVKVIETTTTIPEPTAINASTVSESEIALSATANSDNNSIIVAYNSTTTFGTPTGSYTQGDTLAGGGTILYIGSASNLTNHTNLTANTTYYYKAWSVNDSQYSTTGISTNATTESGITPPTGDGLLYQGFESTSSDTWNYTLSIPSCNSNGSDVWDVVPSLGSISTAATDTNFFGIRDLDGNCGTSDGGIITFNNTDISGYEDVTLSFAINVVGYDVSSGDTISYELFYDNVSQGTVVITDSSPYSTDGWETISQNIPNTVSSVQLSLSVKQNGGSDYAGFDDIQLTGTAIPTTPSLVINEVDADTTGSDTLEFVELYDGGNGNSSLDGFVLVMYNGSNDQSYGTYDLDGYTTNENGYFVAGNEAVANVNLIFPSNGLQNGADAVALYLGNATDFPNGTIVTTENLIDAFIYDTNDGDDAGLLTLLNEGQLQINENQNGNKDNESSQRIANGSGGARNTSTYIQDTPTPGTENGAITPPVDLTIAEARSSSEGTIVTITGVLTASDQFRGSAYIQDDTAAIAIFDQSIHGDGVFAIGDSITLTGTKGAFKNQIQLSNVTNVINNGVATNPIQPKNITLAELSRYPAQLVQITNPSFPNPNQLLFGNSNYQISDTSGSAALRIDNDVTELVGLAQPESCNTTIGVVGRFLDTYQVLPRSKVDLSCATTYEPSGSDLAISKDKTLDVVAWNIEWFGDERNSPAAGNENSDQIQKEKAQHIIQELDADVYTVEEIADPVLFAEMVSELNGYDFVLSDAVSYPSDTEGTKQQIGFIYNTETISPKSTKALFKSIHPYYNNGDASALVDYPNEDKTRFYASGRLPFLMTADVTLNGDTQEIDFIALHARANSGSAPQERYDMRKYDVEVLKDSLDAHFVNRRVVILGDFNDDIDVTVADITSTTSSYEAYVQDSENYNILSSTLSDEGFRSYVFRENMIDHIMVTNELTNNFIPESARVHYEFYNADYSKTTSDHFPVSARLQLKALTIDELLVEDASCTNQIGNATATISGGIQPYSYDWNSNQTTENTVDLEAGNYTLTVTDALNNSVQQEFVINASEPLSFDLSATTETVYYGYAPKASTTLSVETTEGSYEYNWNTGDTDASINVSPTETTTYEVTVTNETGCSETKSITIEVVDVRCKKHHHHHNRVLVCYKNRTKCVHPYAVSYLLKRGATLGSCGEDNNPKPQITKTTVSPNPVRNVTTVYIKSTYDTNSEIIVYDLFGRIRFRKSIKISEGSNSYKINLGSLRRGLYFMKVKDVQGRTVKILKY